MQEFSYFHTFNVKAKERWLNKSLLDALTTEYKSRSKEYFINAIKSGSILLNNKKTNINHILNHHDLISHTIHIHEPLSIEIPIISVSDDLLVVNKPGGIACHPTSNYNYFTVTKILEKKYGKLSCINRLDVPTSGVLLLSRNVNNELFEMMKKKIC
ncbi:DRAP deaminase [Gurleya vavrai]